MAKSPVDAQSLLEKSVKYSPQFAREVANPNAVGKKNMLPKTAVTEKPKMKKNPPAPMLGVYKKKM